MLSKLSAICVTGGDGFLGKHVIRELELKGYSNIFVPKIDKYDLRKPNDVASMINDSNPDVVIHLAASVGGIGANRKYPGQFFYDNAIMGIQLLEQARLSEVKKFVTIGTICAYPKYTPIPFEEANLWNGYPEETNAPYGLAKKMLLVQGQAYRKQYGFNSIYLLPVNLYGPGDNYEVDSSHVIPALIRKCIEARNTGQDNIVVWGSGIATREFLFVKDAASAIVLAMDKYDGIDPINIGADFEISIKELVHLIASMCGFTGDIVWDTTKPDGQPRRRLNVDKARAEFGFTAKTVFKEGLQLTIDEYERMLCIN